MADKNQVTPDMLAEVEASGGTKRISFTDEGAKVEDVPQASIDRAEKNAAAQAARAAESSEVLSLLAPATEVLVETREIEVGGKLLIFNIKRLSHSEVAKLDAKKYRRAPNQQLIKDVEVEETVGMAWLIHLAVVCNANEGKTDQNGEEIDVRWVPLFTLEQILGGGKKPGLMSNPNPEAQDLIMQLGAAIWEVNPNTNPIAAAAAAAQMGLG